ncbi:MAG: Nudix family hydrolase [Burkholderiaceae bacterium]
MTSNLPDNRELTEVAVGILTRPDGQVLLAQRPAGKPYAGWWEFPGGKFEPGEQAHQALVRELHEELGLTIHESSAWLVREHAYEHARVRLHFRRIEHWSGEPESREEQAFRWCDPADAGVSPLLPATVPLMRLLALPTRYGISSAHSLGQAVFLERLTRSLEDGLRAVQLREPGIDEAAFETLFKQVLTRCDDYGARLLVNSQHPSRYWMQARGVHLRASDLMASGFTLPAPREDFDWVGASCHNLNELYRAGEIGADFAVLGPVKPTQSHPGQRGIGWQNFAVSAALTPLPVYALGGLERKDLRSARAAGAHGIAMINGEFGQG